MNKRFRNIVILPFLFISYPLHSETCSLCNNEIFDSNKQELCCGHSYHTFCIQRFIRNHANCPKCNVVIIFHTGKFEKTAHDLCCEPDFEELKEKFQSEYACFRRQRCQRPERDQMQPKCLFPKNDTGNDTER